MPGMGLPIVTNSEIRAFRRCPRYHAIAYEIGMRPIAESEAVHFGSLIHVLLERLYRGEDPETALNDSIPDDLDPFERVRVEEAFLGYVARWTPVLWRVEAVEAEFKMPSTVEGIEVAGKIDAIVTLAGKAWIVEHKTTSDDLTPGSQYWQKLRLDTQISTYLEGAKALGFAVEGCIYDVIARPALRPKKATPEEKREYTKKFKTLRKGQREEDETPDEYRLRLRTDILDDPDRYYQRGEVVRLENERILAGKDLHEHIQNLLVARANDRWPRNPEACFTWNRPCEYLPVCTGQASLDSPSYRKADSIHEELTLD